MLSELQAARCERESDRVALDQQRRLNERQRQEHLETLGKLERENS